MVEQSADERAGRSFQATFHLVFGLGCLTGLLLSGDAVWHGVCAFYMVAHLGLAAHFARV